MFQKLDYKHENINKLSQPRILQKKREMLNSILALGFSILEQTRAKLNHNKAQGARGGIHREHSIFNNITDNNIILALLILFGDRSTAKETAWSRNHRATNEPELSLPPSLEPTVQHE